MTYFLILVGIVVLFKTSMYAIYFFEKQYVRNDLEPRQYLQSEWQSKFMASQIEEAKRLGLSFAGSYVTAPHASFTKGPMVFFRSPCGRIIAAFSSARILGFEQKKTELCSRFEDGSAVITSDGFSQVDITKGIETTILWEANLADLLNSHEGRLNASAKTVSTAPAALSLYEEIQMDRARRMIAGGFARWADPAESKMRLTLRGTTASVKANKKAQQAVIRSQKRKMAAKKNVSA